MRNMKTNNLINNSSPLSSMWSGVENSVAAPTKWSGDRENINKINKKMIPLFSNPVLKKEHSINNFYNKTVNSNLNKEINKVISLNSILNIYLRGLNLYNLSFNNFLNKENNNKLKLIKILKYDEYNKLNIIYNNYLYLLNRYLPIFKFRSLIYKLGLFAPKRILKYNYLYTYTFRLRSLHLNKKFKYINLFINKKVLNINNRMVSKLLEKGINLYLEINTLINKKKLNINKYKLNNLFNPLYINNIINKKSLFNKLNLLNLKQNNYDLLNNKKLNFSAGSAGSELTNNIYKNNEILIRNTRKSILNYLTTGSDLNNNYSSPVEVKYYPSLFFNKNNKYSPIINQYLKEMSKFNMYRKGIFISYNKFIGFNFNYTNKLIKNIYIILYSSFKSMYCLISKPVFTITPDKISIQLFYYLFVPNLLKLKKINLYKNSGKKYIKLIRNIKDLKYKHKIFKLEISKYRRFKKSKINLLNLSNNALTKVFSNKLEILCKILSNLFKKPVELNLIRLHYPYFDSNILVNLLGIMINKVKLRIIIRKLFANTVIKNLSNVNLNRNNNIIPAFLSGINIRVAGRLLTQRVVPRKTVKTVIRGASARSKVNFRDIATYSNKNRRGAYSITIKSGQNYF